MAGRTRGRPVIDHQDELILEADSEEKIPLVVEIPPSETMQTQEMTSTSRNSIPANWENILNEKVDEAIARRKNRGRPISIKEDSFTEEVMNVALPPKFKEPTGDFDSTTDPIDHLRLFQDRVRLNS
ncbi:Uncharacterized protein Adt_46176 [Abeliophyllum distichum]|uniref:Uncharacterized protein n=1 Tax=Abeliophyllum distichum TaxID=126358 RepID=A0ABD1P1Z0_9LAMI